MPDLYSAAVSVTIRGPFLTAATGAESYGLDKSAYRNARDELAIAGTHLKGRLRMALEQLAPHLPASLTLDLADWFGAESDEGAYTPNPARLRFSDLIYTGPPPDPTRLDRRARVTIHRESRTASDNLLREIEDLFSGGRDSLWNGQVTFYAADSAQAHAIAAMLQAGLRWLPTLGAEKGVGFGRIAAAAIATPTPVTTVSTPPVPVGAGALQLRIRPREPILVGGIKSGRTNFVTSRRTLSGALIKGALAMALNQAHGDWPAHRPLEDHPADFPDYQELAAHYSDVRVTHALPTATGGPRPVRLPISTVQHEGEYYDTALHPDPVPLVQGRAPVYFVDWKSGREYIGAAEPRLHFVTRTAVDNTSERADDGRLFTYAYLAPQDDQGAPVEWVCDVRFDAIQDQATRDAVRTQFAAAVSRFLTHLGKTGRAVAVEVRAGAATPALLSRPPIADGIALVTLQSDALMLQPERVRELPPGSSLRLLYADYWAKLSDSAVELEDFFAHQGFEGGYLYHRYLGAAERASRPDRYRPYYLTRAGSVFKLRIQDPAAARPLLDRWLSQGLPLPAWAQKEYGEEFPATALWQQCPFVAAAGYGDIAVNLTWHWDKALATSPTSGGA